MKTIHLNTLIAILLFFAGTAPGWSQVNVEFKSFNSFKPSKEKVQAIEAGLEDVRGQIAEEGSSKQIASDIQLIEGMVGDIRKDFKRYKKLPGWDEQLTQFKAENAKLAAAEKERADAARARKNALYQVKRANDDSHLRTRISSFNANPSFERATKVWDGWPKVEEKLQAFQAAYPGEESDEPVKEALEWKAFLEGEFKDEALKLYNATCVEQDPIIEDVWQSKPQNAINMLAKRIRFGSQLEKQLPDNQTLAAQMEKDNKRYKELFVYKDEGGFETWKLDQVKIDPPVGRDSKIEAHIKKALEEDGYEVVLVSMQDTDWLISSNEYGIPEYAYKGAQCGVKKDGKCQRIYGNYRRTYAGGGTYNLSGYFRWFDPKDMSCKNLKQ